MSSDVATNTPNTSGMFEQVICSNTNNLSLSKIETISVQSSEVDIKHDNLEMEDFILPCKRLHPKAILPIRSTTHAAGYDLYAIQDGIVPANGKACIPTGWAIRLPKGKYGRIAPRSGLALKSHLDVGAGVVDEDYSKEVGVVIFNHAVEDFHYKQGQAIAQMIITTCHTQYKSVEVASLPDIDSTRTGGYGSTDKVMA